MKRLRIRRALVVRLCAAGFLVVCLLLLQRNLATSLLDSSAPPGKGGFPATSFVLDANNKLLGQEAYQLSNSSAQTIEVPAPQPRETAEQSAGSNAASHNSLDFYKRHYGYTPPSPRTAKKANCTQYASGDWEWFGLDAKERSRGNEDRTIYEWFFKDLLPEKGTYLELGAFNGVSESNSRFFDECLGWEGMLIEPNLKMKESILRERPHPHKLFFAASCPTEDANETIRFVQASSNAHVARSDRAKRDRRSVDVGCGPLSPVIEALLHGHIHFFSLDVEGAEAQVLQTIDWSKVRVDVMIAESVNNHCVQTCKHRTEVRRIMKKAGYLLYVNGVYRSDLFLHPTTEKRPPAQYKEGYSDVMQSEFAEVWPLPYK